MPASLYLDTSAVLRAILESGTSPELEGRIAAAPALITSRLSLVESSRALQRLRLLGQASEAKLADAQRQISAVWARCELWEITPSVCEMARVCNAEKVIHSNGEKVIHLRLFLTIRSGPL